MGLAANLHYTDQGNESSQALLYSTQPHQCGHIVRVLHTLCCTPLGGTLRLRCSMLTWHSETRATDSGASTEARAAGAGRGQCSAWGRPASQLRQE